MDKDYTILINREYPLPEDFIPEHLVDIGLPFDAVPGEPKRLLEEKTALTGVRKNSLQAILMWHLRAPASIRVVLRWTCPVLQYKWS